MNVVDHLRIFEDTTNVFRSFRDDMYRNINYVNGIQYTAEDIQYLDAHKRPHYVLNLIRPELMAFIGVEESNRIMTMVEDAENSDSEMAELLNALIDQDNVETSAYHQIGIAVRDAAIFRYGVVSLTFERTIKYPEGQYVVRALDPRDVWWDYHPSERDFENSEFMFHSRWYSPEHLIQLFVTDPQRRKELREYASKRAGYDIGKMPYVARTSSSNAMVSTRDKDKNLSNASLYQYHYSDYFDKGLYRVIEMHDRRVVIKQVIMDYRHQEVIEIPDEMKNDREFIHASLELRGLDERAVVPYEVFEYWQSVSAPDLDRGVLLFEKKYPVQGGGYGIKILPFYNFDPDRLGLRSLVDDLIDPQDIKNKSTSSELLLMNRVLNPPTMIGPTAVDDETQKHALKANRTGSLIEVNDFSQIRKEYPDPGWVNLFARKSAESGQDVSRSSAMAESLKGIRPSDASGTLVTRLAAFSESMHKIVWDNVSNFILNIEKKHLAIIQYHMRMPRIVRQVAPNGDEKILGMINKYDVLANQFLNDPSVGKFDVKLDKTKYTRSERQQKMDTLFQYMAQTDPATKADLNAVILELLNVPGTESVIEGARVRHAMITMQNKITLIQLQKTLQEMLAQSSLLPSMTEVQAGQLEVQKLNNTAQLIQLNTAIEQMLQQMNPPQPNGEIPQ